MKICFPVSDSKGLESPIHGHFGSAPAFVILDTDTGGLEDVANADAKHEHGHCSPIKALQGSKVDAVVVGGIGAGALQKLNSIGASVFKASAGTVKDNILLLAEGGLQEIGLSHTCSGGGGCSHH